MLTLTRRRWGLYIVLAHEGVIERGDTWALGPFSAHRKVPDVRAGGRMSGGSRRAGCPGLWPDVRADGVQLRVRSVKGAGFPGTDRMSGLVRMSGAYSSWLFFLLLFHAWPWSFDSPWSSRLYLSIGKVHA